MYFCRRIWAEYHDETVSSVAEVLTQSEWTGLKERSRICPMFVFPIPRQDGFITLLAQWQDNNCLFTFLEEYRQSPMTAQPWMAFAVYEDLLNSKGLALLRGDFTTRITKEEAGNLLNQCREFYLGDGYRHVEKFNHNPAEFDFMAAFPLGKDK